MEKDNVPDAVTIPPHKELYMQNQLNIIDACNDLVALKVLCKDMLVTHYAKDETFNQMMKQWGT